VRSALLQGLLAAQVAPTSVLPTALLRYIRAFHKHATQLGRAPDEVAVQYVRAVRGVSGIVVGAETVAQVARNLDLFQRAAMTESEAVRLTGAIGEVPVRLVDPSAWTSA
jgi:aryl-alcohol dehydrogenase-like predicted oxidoreductase